MSVCLFFFIRWKKNINIYIYFPKDWVILHLETTTYEDKKILLQKGSGYTNSVVFRHRAYLKEPPAALVREADEA